MTGPLLALVLGLWAPDGGVAAAPAADATVAAPSATCSYSTYEWDTRKKKGVGHREVTKPRAELAEDERDPGDPRCTVCREDQVEVAVAGAPKVTVCAHYAAQVEAALTAVVKSDRFTLRSLKGYRPGRTRGDIRDGLRTQFSNHSYGTAIDVNAQENGLYRKCPLSAPPKTAKDIAHCKLGVGGAWDPKRRPKLTILRDGVVFAEFTRFWKWGGDLPGPLKDFMHFSLTGE